MSFKYHGETIANAALGTTDAEAYAVGTRDGLDVVSSDKTYKNNAKYYAELAKNQVTQISQSVQQVAENAEAAQLAENNCEQYSRGVSQYAETARDSAQESVDASVSAEQSSSIALTAAEEAKQAAELAQAVTGVKVASSTQLGVVRGGDNHISEDGTLQLLNRTTDSKLENCYAGGLLIHEIRGNSVQNNSDTTSPNNPELISKPKVSKLTVYNEDRSAENSVTFSNEISLHGINNVFDKISETHVERKFIEYTITGDENIYVHDNGRIYVPIDSLHNKIKAQGEALCTVAINDKASDAHDSGYYFNTGLSGVYFSCNDVFTDAGSFVEYAIGNSISIVVELNECTEESLAVNDIIALHSLKTFKGTTNVETDSDVQVIIESEYGTSSIGALTILTYNQVNALSVAVQQTIADETALITDDSSFESLD